MSNYAAGRNIATSIDLYKKLWELKNGQTILLAGPTEWRLVRLEKIGKPEDFTNV